MTWYMGIDIGSAYSKGVIILDSEIFSFSVTSSGANYRETAEKIRQELLQKLKLSQGDITATVATGTGAGNVQFASQKMSDMICTARGINSVFPNARTVIDIAGQSTKVLRIDTQGMVTNFSVSEKCAAGSGRFIEVIANVLRIKLSEFGPLSLTSKSPVAFSTGCAVFGESEAVTRVAEGIPKEDIAAGVNKALADKAASLVKKVQLEAPCAVCGGGALNIGLVTRLEQELGINVLVPPQPQIVTALGAALAAQSSL
jgi:predicted CoA-substrate-specific enzyme activase